jgi:hypothetical protein
MFTQTGNIPVVIGAIVPTDSRFSRDPNAFDICVHVTAANGDTDHVRLEFSGEYGKGNFANRTQAAISMDTLIKLGFEGDDLSILFGDANPLAGKAATVHAETSKPNAEGKTFINVRYFVTGGAALEPIAADSVKARMAALLGGAGDSQAPKPTAAAGNPFAKPAAAPAPAPAKKPTVNPFA